MLRNLAALISIGAFGATLALADNALAWPTVTAPTYSELCTGVRNVGTVNPGDSCPADHTGNWHSTRLFGPGQLPPALSVYCLYEWQGVGTPDRTTLPAYLGTPGEDWTDPDCLAVSTQSCPISTPWAASSEIKAILGSAHHASFSAQVDDVPGTLLPAGGVTVAVIDSETAAGMANNFHGLAMMGIVGNRSCDHLSGPCPITTTPYLGIDYPAGSSAPSAEGGDYGFIGALAPLIYQAQQDSVDPRLIVNLSIGWSEAFHGSQNVARYAEGHHAAAVRDALDHIRCTPTAGGQPALVIAAAGNTSGAGALGVGPLYPAAWEQLATTCSMGSEPLVTAVGGVDGADQPLVNSRQGATPKLVAAAHEGIALDAYGATLVGGVTGTSVGAAVASGAAALMWAVSPTLSPSDIRAQLYAASVPLGYPAEFCFSGTCPDVGRLSVCQAAGLALGAPLACMPPLAYSGSVTTWTAAERNDVATCLAMPASDGSPSAETYEAVDSSGNSNLVFIPASAPCTEGVWTDQTAGTLTDWACPQQQLPTRVAGGVVDPQPGGNLCPHCMMDFMPGVDALTIPIPSSVGQRAFPRTLNFISAGSVTYRVDVSSFTTSGGTRLVDGIEAGRAVVVRWQTPSVRFDKITLDFVDSRASRRVVSVSDVEF